MHTQGMTMEQAREFFVKEGRQVPVVGEMETKRGTGDPTYLMYTLGKLEILKLREDYRRKMGGNFSLQDVHDRFIDRKSTRLNSSHITISYAVFCLKKKMPNELQKLTT